MTATPALRAACAMVAFHAWTARVVPTFGANAFVSPAAALPIDASGSRSVLKFGPARNSTTRFSLICASVGGKLGASQFIAHAVLSVFACK